MEVTGEPGPEILGHSPSQPQAEPSPPRWGCPWASQAVTGNGGKAARGPGSVERRGLGTRECSGGASHQGMERRGVIASMNIHARL